MTAFAGAVPSRRRIHWRRIATIGLPLVAAGVLLAVLSGRRDVFLQALDAAPLWLLGAAVALQLLALLVRSEAWRLCVAAAGSTISRRGVFRASGIGGLAGILNGQLGVAARIAALGRCAPAESPRVPALVTAEVPILAIEATLAALTSFTLLGPLGLPWWAAALCVAVATGAVVGLTFLARRRTTGLWSGLAILRSIEGRSRIVVLVLIAVFAQIARNWLALRALGVEASVFDAIAVLIAMVVLSQLPIGPSVGAAAVVIILGANGVALTAAAGVLLSATGMAGTLCFGGWALADRLLALRPRALRVRRMSEPSAAELQALAEHAPAARGALPPPRVRGTRGRRAPRRARARRRRRGGPHAACAGRQPECAPGGAGPTDAASPDTSG